jgi:hypothetical protein
MPVGQVILIDTARQYQRLADEYEKWFYVSYRDATKGKIRSDATLRAAARSRKNMGGMLAGLLLPAVDAVRSAEMRAQWQRKALQVIEALRMHAATTGKFPASLDEVYLVPVPDNPVTNQPYVYHLKDGMAVLELPASDGIPGIAWRFEIKLASNQ